MPVKGYRWAKVTGGTDAFKRAKPVIERECQAIIDEVFKPRLAKVKRARDFNYPIAVLGGWHGESFRFALRLRTGTHVLPVEEFDSPFTRLEFEAANTFNLYSFRHTGKWAPVDVGVTLEEARTLIREKHIYQPIF